MSFVATPTEYAGIVFRSKSEAQVALSLDMQEDELDWAYEPKELQVGSYIPDFLVCEHLDDGVWLRVVECKPSLCTETYMKNLSPKFCEIAKLLRARCGRKLKMLTCEIWQGNTFNMDYKTWMHVGFGGDIPDGIKKPFDDGILSIWMQPECIEAVRRYRFDLEVNHA